MLHSHPITYYPPHLHPASLTLLYTYWYTPLHLPPATRTSRYTYSPALTNRYTYPPLHTHTPLHSTFYSLYSLLLYTLHPTLYTPHSTLYPLHSTLYTLHSALYTLHSTSRCLVIYEITLRLRLPKPSLR